MEDLVGDNEKYEWRFWGPAVNAALVLILLFSFMSCSAINDMADRQAKNGDLLPYPGKDQTCIVQKGAISGCFPNAK